MPRVRALGASIQDANCSTLQVQSSGAPGILQTSGALRG